eukprot:5682854-Prymnesium_polylepis.1
MTRSHPFPASQQRRSGAGRSVAATERPERALARRSVAADSGHATPVTLCRSCDRNTSRCC